MFVQGGYPYTFKHILELKQEDGLFFLRDAITIKL